MQAEQKQEIADWAGMVDAALEVGRSRNKLLQLMRAAFERGDDSEALRLGKLLCGLENEKASN